MILAVCGHNRFCCNVKKILFPLQPTVRSFILIEWQTTYPSSGLTARQLLTAYDNLTKATSGGGGPTAEMSAPKRTGQKRKLSGTSQPPLSDQLIEKVIGIQKYSFCVVHKSYFAISFR